MNWTVSIRQPIFGIMTANEQGCLGRVADREKLLLDKTRQFKTRFVSRSLVTLATLPSISEIPFLDCGEYIDSLDERPVD